MDLDSVANQLRQLGLMIESSLRIDTNSVVRCKVEGDTGTKKSGWYRLYSFTLRDGAQVVTGAFGNYKSGEKGKVEFDKKFTFTDEDKQRYKEHLAEQKKKEKIDTVKRQNVAAEKALIIWNGLNCSGESDYLKRKQVKGHSVKYDDDGVLYIPLLDIKGKLWGIQQIFGAVDPSIGRDKNFIPKGLKKFGCFSRIGAAPVGKEPVVLAEGYATAASVYEATGFTTYVCFDAGNLAPTAEALRGVYPVNPMIICADDDFKTTNSKGDLWNVGREKAKKVVEAFNGYMIYPSFSDEENRGTDFNDLHCIEGIHKVGEQVKGLLSAFDVVDWRSHFITTLTGKVTNDIANVELVLEHDPAWQGVIAYSEFGYRIMKLKPPPFANGKTGEWEDSDTSNLRIWLGRNYGFTPRTADALDSVLVNAKNNKYHPLKDYFNSLEWDGVPRVDCWLESYFGASVVGEGGKDRTQYVRAVSRKFLIAAVARAIASPIKADCVLILEGKQGKGKSTAVDVLAGGYYTDTHFSLGDKDGFQQMMGVWFVELAELDSFNKAESTRAKQFFAAKEDRYRPSYGRIAENFPRQCVFVGTTNQDTYLKDATGDRRYWPVCVTNLDIEALKKDRDQLFAEALALFREGVPWWVQEHETPLFESEQEDRYDEDVWESPISLWTASEVDENFTLAEIFKGALNIDPSHMKPPEQNRIGKIMKRLNFKKVRRDRGFGSNKKRVWTYEKPKDYGLSANDDTFDAHKHESAF